MNSSPEESQNSKFAANLRHFRFNKRVVPVLSHGNTMNINTQENAVVKKVEKDVEGEKLNSETNSLTQSKGGNDLGSNMPTSSNDTKEELPSATEPEETDPPFNEAGFKGLCQFFRTIDPEIVRRCLIRGKGDCVKAKAYVREEIYGGSRSITLRKNENGESKYIMVISNKPNANTLVTAKGLNQVTPVTSTNQDNAMPSVGTTVNTNKVQSVSSPVLPGKTPCVANVKTEPSTMSQHQIKVPLSVNHQLQTVQTNSTSSAEVTPALKRRLGGSKGGVPREKHYKRIKKVRRDSDYNSGNDTDDNDTGGFSKDHRVFDSDEDSEGDISNDTTDEQKQVLHFLSSATLSELLCVPQTSKKKAEAILEARPFESWRDMVDKFQQSKSLGTEILNSANEFLYTRHVVTQLMNKCSKLSADLERDNFAGTMALKTQPSLLSPKMELAGYQLIGLNWLVMLQKKGLNGILADEMGLGKTVQVIAFLARLKETTAEDRRKPHLVVVPSSTLENWSNEIQLWCPSLQLSVYYGTQDERKAMRLEYANGGVNEHDVVLTTYNLLTTSPAERKMFRVLEFDYVIFDEAHMLKNMNTVRYEHLSHINAKRRILLTGTPLQNNLLELMSLLTFVMPDLFYNKKEYLKCLFTRNSTKEKNEKADGTREATPRFEQEQIVQAKKIMKPFVLRRLKKDVLKDLPIKTDHLWSCAMSERQRDMYDNLIRTFSKSATEKTDDDSSGKTMSMMMQLRKVANHPLLVRNQYTEYQVDRMAQILVKEPNYQEKNLEYAREDLSILSDFELHCLCQAYKSLELFTLRDDYILDSGKFKKLDKLMADFQSEGHRVLIFSQFVTMLNVLESYMNLRGHQYLRLDGSTAVTIRQELIDQFNQDPSIKVFLLSTRAGGLGINLTAADTVIIHDIDFNPYNDKQAEDRCHRVGQTKPVTVYRFVSENSIEEDIHHIAREKLHLEKEISADDIPEDRVETKWVLKKALGIEASALPSSLSGTCA